MGNYLTASMSLICILVFGITARAQTSSSALTIPQIMQDPKWMGSSPSGLYWGADGETLYFKWNPDESKDDSLYRIQVKNRVPVKVSVADQLNIIRFDQLNWNEAHTAYVYEQHGDIFYKDVKKNRLIQITQTTAAEQRPAFGFGDKKIIYQAQQNLFAWDIETGAGTQLTHFVKEAKPSEDKKKSTPQSDWLMQDQLETFEVLRDQKNRKENLKLSRKLNTPKTLRELVFGNQLLGLQEISPDGRFISYRLRDQVSNTGTKIPEFVTETGYTEWLNGRPKVGQELAAENFFIYDRVGDIIYKIDISEIPGIKDIPVFLQDYPTLYENMKSENKQRGLSFQSLKWSPDAAYAFLEIHAQDNKDRWLMLWDTATKKMKLLDRQHDEAWIGGPGIHPRRTGWLTAKQVWFQSEETGFSHLYVYDVSTGNKKQLTHGAYEILEATLSKDRKYFYVTSNKVHPGEKQFYRIRIKDGFQERITQQEGANWVTVSPDEKEIAYIFSYKNIPSELFLQKLDAHAKPFQVTHKAQSAAFSAYQWRDPELIQIPARDGASIYARLYKPKNARPGMPAVLFVHGAGYLQNAHKWWSSYFREFMFNNFLADQGYYVLDIDYRGSAGYGRDWRTGIYRHMGGKDLTDHVDAAAWLQKNYAVDSKKIGLYGGSYGGFITLMGLFTEPDIFQAGAALRPVTDWAQYNHSYTANILNNPFTDSLAYRRSSPLYYAQGLQGHLLICHGMVDVNVHFQDAVKLSQRLLELGKDNWELMGYPMEDHGFVLPSSWRDEYKRIFKLFESVLK